MFGLEKKPNEPFEFDLEVDLHKDPAKAKALLKNVEERVGELKIFSARAQKMKTSMNMAFFCMDMQRYKKYSRKYSKRNKEKNS